MAYLTDNSPELAQLSVGAVSLLTDCVGAKAGQRLLIVEEPKGAGFYDDDAPGLVAKTGRALGLMVYETEAPVGLFTQPDIKRFMESLPGFDHVVFFARVGDQIRFEDASRFPPATMCYTLGCEMLDSSFGTACHFGLTAIKEALDRTFANAEDVHVTCPLGTNYRGQPPEQEVAALDVSINRFPLLVPSPVDANGFSGEVVLSRFLIGTGSRFYEPYMLNLETDVTAIVENNRIEDFAGETGVVERIREHYEFVAGEFGIDPWFVHSWHAGIHPGCAFTGEATTDMMRWSGSAFGNPRLLHFHTCGAYAPGEISWNIVDATVRIDGVAIWENGIMHPERLTDAEALLDQHSDLMQLYRQPRLEIGFPV